MTETAYDRMNSAQHMREYQCVNCKNGNGMHAYVWLGVTVCDQCHEDILASAHQNMIFD